MTYADGRLIHDADSHLMELPDCLDPYFEAHLLERYKQLPAFQKKLQREEMFRRAAAAHADPEFRASANDNLLTRKNWEAHGAFLQADRIAALDLLGFASQLVFTTHSLANFGLDKTDDVELCYAAADAQNRMMLDFCSADPRMLATAYIPLEDFDLTRATAEMAIKGGAKALLVPSYCPQRHSPSHIGLDPLWAMAEEAGLPIVFHVGYEDKLNPTYKVNGLPAVPDFHGGDDNFTSISYMPIPNSAMQTLSTLIFDGVFDRFEGLKFGAIELGAAWVPGWMQSMDSAAHAFKRNEERLQKLSAKPSEIAKRQFRAAPYPHEDAGWIIDNIGEDICMFSSDYPHVEGGRNPLKRFDMLLEGKPQSAKDKFYAGNFIDMMGKGLAPELRHPQIQAAE